MKKIITAVATTLFLIGLGTLTACSDFLSKFEAPTDTWVYKEGSGNNSFTYTYNEAEIKFDLYVNYTTSDGTINFKGDAKGDIKTGVNVILLPRVDASDSKAVAAAKELLETADLDDVCIFHSFGTSATAGEGEGESTQNLTTTLWTAIYNFNNFEEYKDKQFSKLAENWTLATNAKIEWKTVLYRMLGDKLLS